MNLPQQPIMKKWWEYMEDIMETNADNSPVQHFFERSFLLTLITKTIVMLN